MITKLVEGNFIACMDEGSNPSDSTFFNLNISLGFFIDNLKSLTAQTILVFLTQVFFLVLLAQWKSLEFL